MKAWYFSDESRRLRYGDGRKIAVGVKHTVDCVPVLCKSGLHASVRAIDALEYAPGPIIWRVELGGTINHENDKCSATKRTYVAGGVDATETLRAFARACALDVVHLWDAPQVVKDYLVTGDESLRASAWAAAMAAAWAAASWAAARDAASWAAARAAASWAAARGAARAAAWAAAWAAASWAAARDAARDAACGAQNARLESMLEKLILENDA